jgi:hypothetical protein
MAKALKFIPVFEVVETLDERGTRGNVVGYADSRESVDVFAKGKGWYGGMGAIIEATALVIDGKVYPLRQPGPVELHTLEELCPPKPKGKVDPMVRRAAIAKLTPEERESLGV